ncbi:MAG: arsenate reductase family protein [Clostridiales bacterium]|nr:arsenate reductase family protein [Clostridiales bacterium]
MELLFVAYPKCSTCQKARRYLEERGVSFVMRDIREERPTAQELEQWHRASGLPLKRFVNTSGLLYRSMDLKNRLPAMTEEEIYALLATDGMLVKRPLLIGEDFVLTGFRQGEWDAALSKD